MNKRWALLEQLTVLPLPGRIITDNCLITPPTHSPYKIPVVLRNETSHDIALLSNCVVAELSIPQEIIAIQSTSVSQKQSLSHSWPLTITSCSSQQQSTSHTSQ